MIDWITCKITTDRRPAFGTRIEVNETGEILVERDLPRHVESHSTSVFVVPCGEQLLVSGNPSKYLQGHNVWALDDWRLVDVFLDDVCGKLGVIGEGIVSVSRLDITHSVVLPSEQDVQAALSALGTTTAERWGRPVSRNGSVYYGHAKRVRLVCYSKAAEFRRNMRRSDYAKLDLLPILRLEVRLGRNWFDENDWRQVTSEAYRLARWTEMIERIRINELETLDVASMPRRVQKVYGLWVAGVDLAQVYSRASLYRYARELREFGIDIWAPYEPSNVVHLKRVLQTRPLCESDITAMGLPVYRCA